jgi:hypothetical protein
MAFPILSLPPEILQNIASVLPVCDIKHLRLVNRALSLVSSRYMFETIFIEVLPESLQKLQCVAAHPVFSKGVRFAFFLPNTFHRIDDLDEFKGVCFTYLHDIEDNERNGVDSPADLSFTDEEWANSYRKYNELAEQQLDMIKNSTVDRTISETLPSFPKLRKIMTCPFYDPLDPEAELIFETATLKKALRHTLLHPRMHIEPDSVEFWAAFLSATAHAGIRLNEITLRTARESSFFDRTFVDEPFVQSSLSHLRSLVIISCAGEDTLSEERQQNIVRLLSRMPMLEELLLSLIGCDEQYAPFHIIGPRLPWAHLRLLILTQLGLHQDELVTFVTDHQSTLQCMLLMDCPLETGSWSSVHSQLKQVFPESIPGSDERAELYKIRQVECWAIPTYVQRVMVGELSEQDCYDLGDEELSE